MAKPSQSQVREINRTLLATVRADFTYPPATTKKARRNGGGGTGRMTVKPLSYRERYYSTSDGERDGSSASESDLIESSDEEDTIEASWSSPETEKEFNPLDDDAAATAGTAADLEDQMSRRSSSKRKRRRFKSPADVAAYLECKTERRKRKKLQIMADELSWNDGFRQFTLRRNAWTCAMTPEEVQQREEAEEAQKLEAHSDECVSNSLEPDVKELNDSTSSASNEDDTDSSTAVSPPLPDASKNQHDASPSPDRSPPEEAPLEHPLSAINVLVPIAIPFLPATHPVRASILSRSHAELYEKIVRDGRTPAVPLNLSHMMSVIVQGWKDEGNWPPKSALAEAGILAGAGSRRLKVKNGAGTSASSHVRTSSESKIAGLFEGHKHLQRGVESVRRAFRLSGSGPSAGD